MKKPWSITTTTHSPYRLRDQLRVLRNHYAGLPWRENQANFQIALIQYRIYGLTSQFVNTLSKDHQMEKEE